MSFVWRTLTDEEEERLLTAMALDGVAPPPRESPSPRTFFENALKTVASASQVPTVPNQTSEIPNFQQMLDQLGYGTPTNHGNLLNFNDMTVPQAQTAPAAQSLPSEPVLNFGLPQVPISAGIWPTNMNSLIPTLNNQSSEQQVQKTPPGSQRKPRAPRKSKKKRSGTEKDAPTKLFHPYANSTKRND